MAFAESRVRHDESVLTRTPDLVRWGPVVAGVIIGLGFFALLTSLWFAIAAGAGGGWVSGNLAWFIGVTAAAALLVAGWIAGALAGVRGMLAGLVNGLTAWGLLFILSITAVLPGAANLTGLGMAQGPPGPMPGPFTTGSALWTTFWSLLVGLVLAGAGGVLGGRMVRPVSAGEEGPSVSVPTQRTRTVEQPARGETVDEGGEVRRGSPR